MCSLHSVKKPKCSHDVSNFFHSRTDKNDCKKSSDILMKRSEDLPINVRTVPIRNSFIVVFQFCSEILWCRLYSLPGNRCWQKLECCGGGWYSWPVARHSQSTTHVSMCYSAYSWQSAPWEPSLNPALILWRSGDIKPQIGWHNGRREVLNIGADTFTQYTKIMMFSSQLSHEENVLTLWRKTPNSYACNSSSKQYLKTSAPSHTTRFIAATTIDL